MSHFALPPHLFRTARNFATRLDWAVQAEAYAVLRAQGVHRAFGRNFIGAGLERGLICDQAGTVAADPVKGAAVLNFHDLGSGGWFTTFRPSKGRTIGLQGKVCRLDAKGDWVPTVNASSYLAKHLERPKPPKSLFDGDDYDEPDFVPPVMRKGAEVWYLMMLIDSDLRTFGRMAIGRPVGLLGSGSPYTVLLDDIREIPTGVIPPVAFPKSNDDLFGGDAQEDDEGEDGEASDG